MEEHEKTRRARLISSLILPGFNGFLLDEDDEIRPRDILLVRAQPSLPINIEITRCRFIFYRLFLKKAKEKMMDDD